MSHLCGDGKFRRVVRSLYLLIFGCVAFPNPCSRTCIACAFLALGPEKVIFVTCCVGKEPSDKDALRYLYGSHFMSAWGDRMWGMAVPLFLIDIFKSTLLPTGLYAAFVYILNVFFEFHIHTTYICAPKLSALSNRRMRAWLGPLTTSLSLITVRPWRNARSDNNFVSHGMLPCYHFPIGVLCHLS